MKISILISLLTLVCLSVNATTNTQLKFKDHKELSSTISQKVDALENITAENKERLKAIFTEAIKKSSSYKKQESKLVQSYVESKLDPKKDYDEVKFDKEFQKIYAMKLKNIRNTAKQLNTILKKKNNRERALQDFIELRDNFKP